MCISLFSMNVARHTLAICASGLYTRHRRTLLFSGSAPVKFPSWLGLRFECVAWLKVPFLEAYAVSRSASSLNCFKER